MLDTQSSGFETGIACQVRPFHRIAEVTPMVVDRSDYDYVVVVAAVHTAWRPVRQMFSRASHLHTAARQAINLNGSMMIGEVRIEEGDVDVLALAGMIAMEQRGYHRERAMNARADVANRGHRKVRRPVGFADHRGDSRVSLSDEVVAREMSERPGLAEG